MTGSRTPVTIRPITVYNQNAGVTTTTQDDQRRSARDRYNGLDIIVDQAFEARLDAAGGYTYSQTKVDLTSLSNPNNAFVNAGGVSGGRRHNFKASGSYLLPYKVLLAANFRLQSGLPITRTWAVPTCSATVTTNCTAPDDLTRERRAARQRRTAAKLPTLDLRAGRFFDFRRDRVELSMDIYNLTNANTVFNVRDRDRPDAHPRQRRLAPSRPRRSQTFLSPTQFLAPRVVRFNMTYSFNRGSRFSGISGRDAQCGPARLQ